MRPFSEALYPDFILRAHLTTLCGGSTQYFHPSCDIKSCLAVPAVKHIFDDSRKPGSFGAIVELTEPEVLFNNITEL
jgi:hypothetical protein